MLGPQGSGKGTQAGLLAKKYDLVHLESGEILRRVVSSEGKLGQDIKLSMGKGELVPDEPMREIIENFLSENKTL